MYPLQENQVGLHNQLTLIYNKLQDEREKTEVRSLGLLLHVSVWLAVSEEGGKLIGHLLA